jgi:hypothetical protein
LIIRNLDEEIDGKNKLGNLSIKKEVNDVEIIKFPCIELCNV